VARGLQLDWVLVRVNTIRRIAFAALLLVLAAVMIALGYRHFNPRADQRARHAIEQAELLREQVLAFATPEAWKDNVAAAGRELESAKSAFDEGQWEQAAGHADSAISRYQTMLGVGRSQLGGVGHFYSLEGRV